jgi:hypothetical protein
MTRLPAIALGLLLLAGPVLAQSQNNPIPGIDVVVRKQPGGGALVVGQSGRDGWFRGPVRVEAGEYQVTAACPPRRMCRAFRLAEVRIDGRQITPNARGEYVFPVEASTEQVRLETNTLLQEVSTTR